MPASWNGSTRRDRLPPDWDRIRKRVGRRDAWRCQWVYTDELGRKRKCLELATDVDHIVAGDDHRESNLRCLCDWHHGKKSGAEGAAAAAKKRQQITNRFRTTEEHPGLL